MKSSSIRGQVFATIIGLGLIAVMAWSIVALGVWPMWGSPSSDVAAGCVPTPQLVAPEIDVRRTPTPPMGEPLQPYADVGAKVPTQTAIPVSRVSDLAESVESADKTQVFVFRCDGRIELFLVGPDTKDVGSLIGLARGDTILNSIPSASSMGHIPPTGQPQATSAAIPGSGYPVGEATVEQQKAPATLEAYPGKP